MAVEERRKEYRVYGRAYPRSFSLQGGPGSVFIYHIRRAYGNGFQRHTLLCILWRFEGTGLSCSVRYILLPLFSFSLYTYTQCVLPYTHTHILKNAYMSSVGRSVLCTRFFFLVLSAILCVCGWRDLGLGLYGIYVCMYVCVYL